MSLKHGKEQTFSKAFSQNINSQSTSLQQLYWIWNYVLSRHESITSIVKATLRALYYKNVIHTMYHLAKCWLLTCWTAVCQFSFRTTLRLKSNSLQLYSKEVKTKTKATNHNGLPLDTLPNGVPWNLKTWGKFGYVWIYYSWYIHRIFCSFFFRYFVSISLLYSLLMPYLTPTGREELEK